MVSPRLSFKGYKFSEALYRNKDIIKALIVLVTGYGYFTGFELTTFLTTIGVALAGIAGKLIVDATDFFFSEVQL